MTGFPVTVYVYGLKFETYVIGYEDNYAEEELNEIKEGIKKEIKESLDTMGFVPE